VRILVFGVTGFIGGKVVELLKERGEEVFGVARSQKLDVPVKTFVANVLDKVSVEKAINECKPEAILFAVGERYPKGRIGEDYLALMQSSRVEGTRNVLECIKEMPSKPLFVCLSGALVYKREQVYKGEISLPLNTEKDPIDDSTWFGQTVLKWEAVVTEYGNKFDIDYTIARMGSVYGWGGIWKELFFERIAKRKRVFVPGNARFTTSLIHIEDAASALVHFLTNPSTGEVYNVVDDEPVVFKKFIEHACELFGAPKPLYIPLLVLKPFLGAGYKLVAPAFSISQAVSNEKLKKLGFELKYPSYKEGLKQIFEKVS